MQQSADVRIVPHSLLHSTCPSGGQLRASRDAYARSMMPISLYAPCVPVQLHGLGGSFLESAWSHGAQLTETVSWTCDTPKGWFYSGASAYVFSCCLQYLCFLGLCEKWSISRQGKKGLTHLVLRRCLLLQRVCLPAVLAQGPWLRWEGIFCPLDLCMPATSQRYQHARARQRLAPPG